MGIPNLMAINATIHRMEEERRNYTTTTTTTSSTTTTMSPEAMRIRGTFPVRIKHTPLAPKGGTGKRRKIVKSKIRKLKD